MSILAWHFVSDTLRDGSPIPPDGEWLEYDGRIKMCASGLHASRRLIDALQYSPGGTICCVRVDGVVAEDKDKLVGSRRKIIWRIEGDILLRDFARLCALDVIHIWDAPDVVRQYLEMGDESLRAAARAAAWTAAKTTARAAAGAAAGAAARAAAWDAAWDAAWAAQNKRLTQMVRSAHKSLNKEPRNG